MNTFHEGERAVQERVGVRAMAERVGNGIHDTIPPVAREWLEWQQLAAIAAVAPDGWLWASLVGGEPGFLSVTDERTLLVAAYLAPDDPVRAAIERTADVGGIILEPGARKRMRVNGRAQLREEGITITTRQVYANCPKYIQARTAPNTIANPHECARLVASGENLGAGQRQWVATSDTFFIGSWHCEQGADCSHRGGNPGFVTVAGNTLSWPDYAGNAMFNTLGNLAIDARAGLVFPDWETGAALQLAGETRLFLDGQERRIEFDVKAWRHVAGVLPTPWSFAAYSPFNPANVV